MIATILNLPSWILPSWIQPFCTKLWLKLVQSDSNSFILTQLDDISHLEICNVGFRHCHLGLRYLVIFSQIHSKNTLTLFWPWLKLIQSDSNSFILTQLDDGSHIKFCHLGFSHFAEKELQSFILTQLDDGSHLEFYHVGFRHCHLGFSYLSSFSWTHSHLPRLVRNICTKKLHSFILTQLDDCSYLEICHL